VVDVKTSVERLERLEREDQKKWVEDLIAKIDFDNIRKAQIAANSGALRISEPLYKP
jgi:hypothetical protein